MAFTGEVDDKLQRTQSKGKKHPRKRVISSSDEEEPVIDHQHVSNTPNVVSREHHHSLRRKQPRFRMPSREEQWRAIPTVPSTNKLSRLQPRKLINDFMKVTNRYNYDDLEVSGEESMTEFIKGTDSEDSEDTDADVKDCRQEKKHGHRVKGYKPRIMSLSSESSEEDYEDTVHPPVMEADSHSDLISAQQENNQRSLEHWKTVQRTCRDDFGEDAESHSVKDVNSSSSLKNEMSRRGPFRVNTSDDSDDQSLPPTQKKIKSDKTSMSKSICEKQSLSSSDQEEYQKVRTPSKLRKKSILDSDSDNNEGKQNLPDSNISQAQTEPNVKTRMNTAGAYLIDHNVERLPILSDKTCSENQLSKKHDKDKAEAKSSVPTITISSSEYGSSDSSGNDTDSSETGSSDANSCSESGNSDSSESGVGRIQKLASQRRKRRDSLFGQLQTARAKSQKK